MTRIRRPVSINLKSSNLDQMDFLSYDPGYFEVIADNWLSHGPHHKKLDKVRANHQLLFHCVGMNLGGFDPLCSNYLRDIKRMIERWQPMHISDHLCIQSHQGQYVHDLLPFALNESSLSRVANRIEEVQDLLDTALVIENLSYYIRFSDSDFTEAEFLNQLAKITGCGILLDINNLDINDKNSIYSKYKFLEELDLSFVKEIHIAGGEQIDQLWIDTHASQASPWVKQTLKQIHATIPDVPVIYEWDNKLPSFEERIELAGALSED